MRNAGLIAATAFIVCIALANYATATYQPWHVAGLIITAGTWFAAATFILRDVVQVAFGRRSTYALIVAALIVDLIYSRTNGDLYWVTLGSVGAFACSESLDSIVFTRYRTKILQRVLASGVCASIIDSFVFCILALSPLTTGFVAWGDLWRVVLAQLVAKFIVVIVGSAISSRTLPQPVVA